MWNFAAKKKTSLSSCKHVKITYISILTLCMPWNIVSINPHMECALHSQPRIRVQIWISDYDHTMARGMPMKKSAFFLTNKCSTNWAIPERWKEWLTSEDVSLESVRVQYAWKKNQIWLLAQIRFNAWVQSRLIKTYLHTELVHWYQTCLGWGARLLLH